MLQTNYSQYHQELRDTEEAFGVKAHTLEVQQAVFQRQIKDKYDAEVRRAKELSEEAVRAERLAHQLKDQETTDELRRRNDELAATETAAALIVKQKEYEKIEALNLLQQEQQTARLGQEEQDEEYQRVQHLLQQEKELRAEEQLRSEKEKLKQDSQQHLAALENIVKEHNLNMVRTNELVTALPKVKKGKQSKHQL